MEIQIKSSITFGSNWNNKLDCQAFTTFRLHNPKKHLINSVVDIYLKEVLLYSAKIVDVKTMKLEQVNDFIAHLDTGYSAEDFKKLVRTMYKNIVKDFETQKFDLLLIKRL